MNKIKEQTAKPQTVRSRTGSRMLLTALATACAVMGSLAPAASAHTSDRAAHAVSPHRAPDTLGPYFLGGTKTFYVGNLTNTLKATVRGFTTTDDWSRVVPIWRINPPKDTSLFPRSVLVHNWDMNFLFSVTRVADVQYGLTDAKTGAPKGFFDIHMETNDINRGSAECNISSVPNITCDTSIDDRGSVHITLLQE